MLLNENGEAYYCRCHEQKQLERLFKSSKITPAFKTKTLDNFLTKDKPAEIRQMLATARHYVEQFAPGAARQPEENNWLLYLGEPGCGKTHLSLAVAQHLLQQGMEVLYFPHVEGIDELKYVMRDKGDALAKKMEKLMNVQLLVWDDLFKGRGRPTDWVLEIVFEILNNRYLNLRPCIISSEKNAEQLMEIDRGTGSRILERGKRHTVIIEGGQHNHRING